MKQERNSRVRWSAWLGRQMQHPDKEINQAIIQLNDALCTWERSTGRQSVLIIREEGGWQHRSMSGKPGIPDDVTDEQLMATVSA
jgi:hypothetical protein